MSRLTRYLLGLFFLGAAALFGIAAFLVFLIQCVTLFGLIVNRGQSVMTLIGQALLGMPAIVIVFFSVCMGIGLGRSLRSLQESSELGIIHINGLVGGLMRSILLYALGGALGVLALAHIVDPLCQRSLTSWSATIAADLVSRSMVPHRFTEIVDGVAIVIGSRDSQGNITDFFADDSRDATRRKTYFARTAIITRDARGYILRLYDGALQELPAAGGFSEVAFHQYDLPLDSLTEAADAKDPLSQMTSFDILAQRKLSAAAAATLRNRSTEALRVLAICAFIGAIAAFPSGRRRAARIPIEFVVLLAAFAERGVSSFVHINFLGVSASTLLLFSTGALILMLRLRVFRPVRRRRVAA